MVGIFKGDTPVTPSFPGLTAVYVGATKVWPSAAEPGFSQPYPNTQADWDPWILSAGVGQVETDANNLRYSAINSGLAMVTREVAVTPGAEYVFSLEGASTGSSSIVRELNVGTTQWGSDIGQTVTPSSWASQYFEVIFTPVTDTVWVTLSHQTVMTFGITTFNSPRCEPT